MYDIILFALGVWTGRLIWKAAHHNDVREVIVRVVTVVVVLAVYLFPAGYSKTMQKWEQLPAEHYIVSDGNSVNDWNSYGVATVYTNNREFLNSSDNTPILVYNPEHCTAEEARAIYKNEH